MINERNPGRILGQFCGKIPPPLSEFQTNKANPSLKNKFDTNAYILTESTSNALTLWWHTDERSVGKKNDLTAEGFRLLWSSFKVSGIFLYVTIFNGN